MLNPHIFELLGDIKGKTILDAGAGNGYLSRKMAKLGAKATGVEPAQTLFRFANKREEEDMLGINYLQQDLSQFSQPNKYDIVVANMVFMDILDWQSAVENCIEALKPHGKLICSISHPCFENSSAEYNEQAYIKIKRYQTEYAKQMLHGQNYHRTLSTYLNFVIDHGCVIDRLIEPNLDTSVIPHQKDHEIPSFLIISTIKQ